MKCGEVIDLMIGMNWCILIKNECGKVITTINPFHMICPHVKRAFEKNVLYIHADREGVISIYIDVEGEEYGWRLRK